MTQSIPPQTWLRKFATAARGIAIGTRGQNSFYVHLPIAACVVVAAFITHRSETQLCILLVCIGIVLTAELFNSAIERLAKRVTADFDADIGAALDIASGAVLVASVIAAIVGLIIFL